MFLSHSNFCEGYRKLFCLNISDFMELCDRIFWILNSWKGQSEAQALDGEKTSLSNFFPTTHWTFLFDKDKNTNRKNLKTKDKSKFEFMKIPIRSKCFRRRTNILIWLFDYFLLPCLNILWIWIHICKSEFESMKRQIRSGGLRGRENLLSYFSIWLVNAQQSKIYPECCVIKLCRRTS